MNLPPTTPVGALARSCQSLELGQSIQAAANAFASHAQSIVPVLNEGLVVGILTEKQLARAYLEEVSKTTPIDAYVLPAPLITGDTPIGQVASRISTTSSQGFIVVSTNGHLVGYVHASDLWRTEDSFEKPAMVGGMATPFGVYLTTGAIGAGVKWYALSATGAVLTMTLGISTFLAMRAQTYLESIAIAPKVADALTSGLQVLLFLGLMRFSPIAGIHAAEHMTVHAIERNEPLEPEVVARMPRVHARCGTNLAVAITLFLFFISNPLHLPDELAELQGLIGAIFVLFFWRQIGGFVQYWFTTRKPSPKQIEYGIASGKELLKLYRENPTVAPSPKQRLLSSGMPFVLLGSMGLVLLVKAIGALFGWNIPF